MSEKQSFNKDIQNRQMAEKRRERWMSRKILTEILESVRLQRDDANWVLYQVFEKENLTYKSKIKIWNHLMRTGYDLSKEKPEKKDEDFSYQKAWQKHKDTSIWAMQYQKTAEENYKLCQQFNKTNELLKELYTHLVEKGLRTIWDTKEDCKKFGKILDKVREKLKDKS